MSVDFPAPFSPSSACTSPRRRSKSTSSLATTPGNRFVIPFSSRSGASFMPAGIVRGRAIPRPRTCRLLLDVLGLRGRLDRAVLQPLVCLGHGVLHALGDVAVEVGQ